MTPNRTAVIYYKTGEKHLWVLKSRLLVIQGHLKTVRRKQRRGRCRDTQTEQGNLGGKERLLSFKNEEKVDWYYSWRGGFLV